MINKALPFYSFIAALNFWSHRQVQTRRSFRDTGPERQKEDPF